MANQQPWPGSASFSTGSTPFGLYDTDQVFASESIQVADYCAKKLGYPMMEVELQDIQLFACFEEAVSTYALEIYQSKIKDNYLGLEGSPTGSLLNNTVVVSNLQSIITIADSYGAPAGVGGNVDWRTGSISLSSTQQIYDLQLIASQSGWMKPGDRVVVQQVYYEGNPAINQYYDPYIGGSINYQGAAENFGWASYSPGLNFTLFPVYWDIQRIQEIEMSNTVRQSAYTFELINNKLKIFPINTPLLRIKQQLVLLWHKNSLHYSGVPAAQPAGRGREKETGEIAVLGRGGLFGAPGFSRRLAGLKLHRCVRLEYVGRSSRACQIGTTLHH